MLSGLVLFILLLALLNKFCNFVVYKPSQYVPGNCWFLLWGDYRYPAHKTAKYTRLNSLPYDDATIHKILRVDTLNPWEVVHKATRDTKLCGFEIQAGTLMMTDLHAMHHDPDFWGDPENFRPERFLTEDGRLGKDYSLPFGAGSRLCAAETFARQFLFLVSAVLAQNFNFSFVNGEPSSLEDKLPGLSTSPYEFWIRMIMR